MEWEIKVDEKPKERLLVKCRPIYGVVEIIGQYRIRNQWTDFSMADCAIADINLENLQKALADALNDLKTQIEKYEDLEKTFKAIGSITISESEENKKGVE